MAVRLPLGMVALTSLRIVLNCFCFSAFLRPKDVFKAAIPFGETSILTDRFLTLTLTASTARKERSFAVASRLGLLAGDVCSVGSDAESLSSSISLLIFAAGAMEPTNIPTPSNEVVESD